MDTKAKSQKGFLSKIITRGHIDMPFLVLTLILVVIGLVMVLSASYPSAYYSDLTGHDPQYYFKLQARFAVAGVVLMYAVSLFNYRSLPRFAVPLMAVTIIFLLLVEVPGLGGSANGATRWLAIPGLPRFQPSELAKFAVILFFSARMAERKPITLGRYDGKKLTGKVKNGLHNSGFFELVPYGLVLLAVVILLVRQPHMSATVLIMVTAAAILFVGGVHWGWFAGAIIGSVGSLVAIMLTTDYMKSRIDMWLNPWLDPLDGGYQAIQSLIAIGSGGLLGLGLGNSRQKFLYLPEEHNDFIFSVVCEELGLIGAGLILVLFAMLIIRGYWLAMHTKDRFGSLMIVGIITLFATQVVFNVAVVSKLMPVTGVSLPFFSYGGTALVIQLVEMGVVLAISRQIPLQTEDT